MDKNKTETDLNYDVDTVFGRPDRSIRVKTLSLIIIIAATVISACLLIGLIVSYVNYKSVVAVSETYRNWQENAKQMTETSDYLTEQARGFAATADKTYIDNYFKEVNVDKNREKALDYITELSKDLSVSDVEKELNGAFTDSNNLMQTEFRSMRLVVDAKGLDLDFYPQEIRDADISAEAALSDAEKLEKANHILYNTDYLNAKNKIESQTKNCIKNLEKELTKRQNAADSRMRFALVIEIIMVAVLIVYSLFVWLINSQQIFRTLRKWIPLIRENAPLSVEGVRELRILARTYNTMFEQQISEKSHLKAKSEHDPLTGALNRNALDKFQLKKDGAFAFLIVDIDNFKHVNDTYGHPVGDKTLIQVVSYLRLHMRSEDRLFRIGGDEFVVLMFGMDETCKSIIREKVVSINKKLRDEHPAELPPVTVSVGVSFGTELDHTVMAQADETLYKVKQSGKADVRFYGDK